MLRGYSFRPRRFRLRWGALALAAAACAAGIALGQWQTRRAGEKLALAAKRETSLKNPPFVLGASPASAAQLVDRRVAARGAFVAERTVFLDNRNRGGKPGYEVVTPLLLAPSLAVLVRRGWVERSSAGDGGRSEVRTPNGVVRVQGIALARLPRALEVSERPGGAVRQNLEIAEYAREIGLALQPIVIQQANDTGDGLARDWPAPDFGVDMHRAYALQWYALAALAAVLGIVLSFRRVGQG